MQVLPTVWLEHTTAHERHIDWMVLDPTLSASTPHRLWTVRWPMPSFAQFLQTLHQPSHTPISLRASALPHHRHAYLHYQGKVHSVGGFVKRRLAHSLASLRWTNDLRLFQLQTPNTTHILQCQRIHHAQWQILIQPAHFATKNG